MLACLCCKKGDIGFKVSSLLPPAGRGESSTNCADSECQDDSSVLKPKGWRDPGKPLVGVVPWIRLDYQHSGQILTFKLVRITQKLLLPCLCCCCSFVNKLLHLFHIAKWRNEGRLQTFPLFCSEWINCSEYTFSYSSIKAHLKCLSLARGHLSHCVQVKDPYPFQTGTHCLCVAFGCQHDWVMLCQTSALNWAADEGSQWPAQAGGIWRDGEGALTSRVAAVPCSFTLQVSHEHASRFMQLALKYIFILSNYTCPSFCCNSFSLGEWIHCSPDWITVSLVVITGENSITVFKREDVNCARHCCCWLDSCRKQRTEQEKIRAELHVLYVMRINGDCLW